MAEKQNVGVFRFQQKLNCTIEEQGQGYARAKTFETLDRFRSANELFALAETADLIDKS